MTPPSPSRNLAFALIVVVLALVAVLVIARLGMFGGLRGALSTITFGTDSFLYGPLASAENANLPSGTHGIFTCPSSIGTNEMWLGPSNFPGVSGLKIYEYSSDFSAEKNPVSSTWPGERYGFQGSTSPILSTFKAGRTYYVHADQQFAFRCSGPASTSSSSSISSSSQATAADFSVSVSSQPVSVTPGSTASITFNMTNTGPASPAMANLIMGFDANFTPTSLSDCAFVSPSYSCGPFNIATGVGANRQVNFSVSPSAPCNTSQTILVAIIPQSPYSDNSANNNSMNVSLPITCTSSSSSTPISSSSSSAPEAGLIGYWPLNEGSGSVSQDATTGDHDVAFTNNAAWGAPLTGVGSSASLNGVDQYVNIGALALFNFQYNNDFSLGAYVKPSATNPQDGIIVGKVENRGFAFPGWAMTYTSDQHFGFKMSASSFLTPIGLEVKTNATFAPGTTHHVVVSYNGTNATNAGTSNAVKIYVDGTEYSVAQGNLTISLDNLRSPGGISSITNNGEAQIGMGDGAISPFAGQIDDVKIYNQVIVPTN